MKRFEEFIGMSKLGWVRDALARIGVTVDDARTPAVARTIESAGRDW